MVRSEKAPKSGLQTTETKAPSPVTRENTNALWSESIASACWASSTWIGPKKPAHSPMLASDSATTHRAGGLRSGSASAAPGTGADGVTGP